MTNGGYTEVSVVGKVGSIDLSGLGPNSQQLTIHVANADGGATAITGAAEAPNDCQCYPWVFAGFISLALAAQAHGRDISMLYVIVPNAEGKPQNFIQALTVI